METPKERIDFEPDRLRDYLRALLGKAPSEIGIARISGGQSNPTYFVDFGERQVKNIEEPVRVYSVGPNSRPAATADAPRIVITDTVAMPLLPDKPSIAVLPFQNMSGDPEQEYFADGLVEDIITALSWRSERAIRYVCTKCGLRES
jgi:hypothetical protein